MVNLFAFLWFGNDVTAHAAARIWVLAQAAAQGGLCPLTLRSRRQEGCL